MVQHSKFLDSYEIESTWGVSVIPNAATQTHLMGVIPELSRHPMPRWNPQYGSIAVGDREPAGADGITKENPVRQGNWIIILQNGIPFWLAMGSSSTTDLVHTITPGWLPSITMQHDRSGSAPDEGWQFTGVKVMHFAIEDELATPGLIASIDWIAKDATNKGWILSSTPALPATATTTAYNNLVTATYDGNALDGLKTLRFAINPGLKAIIGDANIPIDIVEDFTRRYTLDLTGHWQDSALRDDAVAQANDKDIVLKWLKGTDVNDYIEITMDSVKLLYPELATKGDKDDVNEKIECVPTRVSIKVKDTIAAGEYGE